MVNNHYFGEKQTEISKKAGGNVKVIITAKYTQSRNKAIEAIESGKWGLKDSDFWVLKNDSAAGMIYTGLIISHTGCLKINDALGSGFKPESVSVDKSGFGGSLVVSYCNAEQGIYEFGEASGANCKIAYPYAMALKRCFDRVVLKLSKLAFDGIYSECESDGFDEGVSASEQAQPVQPQTPVKAEEQIPSPPVQSEPKAEPKEDDIFSLIFPWGKLKGKTFGEVNVIKPGAITWILQHPEYRDKNPVEFDACVRISKMSCNA